MAGLMNRRLLLRILLLSAGAAVLMVALKYFELSVFAGQTDIKVYVTIIGVLFLGIGLLTGLHFRRKSQVAAAVSQPPPVHPNELLSNRENEVLQCIAMGLTNRETAEKLFVSENTVKKHLNSIYSKMGVNRRTQALSKAKELGILD